MTTVRVKPTVASVVFDEKTGGFVTLAPNQPFDSADAVVKANKWAFESDDDALSRGEAAGRVVSVNMETWVETATAIPGEKRNVKPGSSSVAVAATPAVDEGGHGPITTQNFGAAIPSSNTPSLSAAANQNAKGTQQAKAGKAKDATPKTVKKG